MADIYTTVENVRESATRYLKTFAMDLVVVLVALAYVFYQMVSLEKTDLNPLVLVAQAIMGIICGVIIKTALGENGFSRGYNSVVWHEEETKYNEACNKVIDYVDERLGNYYLEREIEKKKLYRMRNLQAVRLKYNMWFDENGDYCGKDEEFKKLKLYQKVVLQKCIRVKIRVLNLLSEYANTSEQDTKREMTDKDQRARSIAKNTISACVVAVIGVYFIPIWNWNVASLISSTMQVSMWVLFGILQLYTNYNFIVKDKVATIRKKKEEIQVFVKNCEKGMYLENPYEKMEKKNKELVIQEKNTKVDETKTCE